MKENKYTTISVSQDDYELYEAIRQQVSKQLGTRLSMAAVVRLAMTFYNQRRKFVKEGDDAAA